MYKNDILYYTSYEVFSLANLTGYPGSYSEKKRKTDLVIKKYQYSGNE